MDASIRLSRAALAALLSLLTHATAGAQFATQVVDYSPGLLGSGEISTTDNILGGPVGGGFAQGSTDILSLGEGGSVTLGFAVTIADGPGVDFSVFENPLTFGNVFAEAFFVEVSTDGVSFARFPSSYVGPQDPPDFSLMPIGTYDGFGGHQPVLANVFTNPIDPADPARSGGESFDLAWLAGDALVLGGQVDLAQIHFVRLVDAPSGGTSSDTSGTPVWDSRNGTAANSANVDAVAVIQHTGTLSPDQPRVDLFLDRDGHLNLSMSDPNEDLDMATFHGAFRLVRAGRLRLANLFTEQTVIPGGKVWRTSFPLVGSGILGSLAISIRDLAGNYSADQIFLQG